MTEQEKKLLQAKHRMEEAEARNRKKERSLRTRRLIQEGAILESVFPQAQHMELEALKAIWRSDWVRKIRITGAENGRRLPEGRTYSPPRRGGGISVGNRALSEGVAAVATAYGQCHTGSESAVIVHAVGVRYIPNRIPSLMATVFHQLPEKNFHRKLFSAREP